MIPVGKLSSYANNLPTSSRRRYVEKIKPLNFIDPYTMKLNNNEFPTTVSTGHVVNYLLTHISPSSGNHVKNQRSIEAYRKFESGFVQSVTGGKVGQLYVVRGQVAHSMRFNKPALDAWIIVHDNGTIESGHCNCVAGLSETCSHISTLLYALANLHFMTNTYKLSVTELPSYWARPAKKIHQDLYRPIHEVDYGYKITRMDDIVVHTNRDDFVNFMVDVQEVGQNAAILKKFCDGTKFTCTMCLENWIPDELLLNKNILLQNQFNPTLEGVDFSEVMRVAEDVVLSVSAADVKTVEQLTRAQASCDLWRWVRTGRVCASLLKECTRASTVAVPSKMTLLKKICYPELSTVNSEAMVYGRANEPRAKKAFERFMKDHINVQFFECGVFICLEFPHMSATPDLIMVCDCCGKCTVEIKCPFRLNTKSQLDKQLQIKNLVEGSNPFIRVEGDEYVMVTNHEYYAQVQAQMYIVRADFGYFYIWSKKEQLCLRIEKDEEFWVSACSSSTSYFKNIILPELLSNHFSNKLKT